MKQLFSLLLIISSAGFLSAQCQAQITAINPDCQGNGNGSATAAMTNGQQPFTYLWSNGQTNATATGLFAAHSYTCTITDANSCVATTSCNIPFPLRFHVNITSPASCPTCCNGVGTIVVDSACSYPVTYQWSPSGGTAPMNTAMCGNVNYTVNVVDVCGCGAADMSVVCGFATGIREQKALPALQVSPNPFGTSFEISLEAFSQGQSLYLLDLTGRVIRTIPCTGNHLSVSREGMAPGMYFIQLREGDKLLAGSRIIAE